MTTSAQATVLILYSAVIGAVIGSLYDIFRMLRIALPERIRGTRAETVIVFFQDILFWIITSLIFIIFIYHANKGHARLIMIASACMGFAVYYITLGRVVIFFSDVIIGTVKKLINGFIKIFIKPLIFVITRVIMFTIGVLRDRSNRRVLKKLDRLSKKGYGL